MVTGPRERNLIQNKDLEKAAWELKLKLNLEEQAGVN